jgi:hypothetical protein
MIRHSAQATRTKRLRYKEKSKITTQNSIVKLCFNSEFKRIMSIKLAECNNKKKFIESIQNKGMEQLEEANKYFRNILAIKHEAEKHLNELKIR